MEKENQPIEEVGFQEGIRYTIRKTEAGEYNVHAEDHVNNQATVIKTFKTTEEAHAFADSILGE